MAFLDRALDPPSYGWRNHEGELVRPSPGRVLRETLSHFNLFASRKRWMAISAWVPVLAMIPLVVAFFRDHVTWPLGMVALFYGMVVMSTHGTLWYHRYCTHRAYEFSHPLWRWVGQNLAVRVIPEELYVVSHHVHHARSDRPGDPYHAGCGFLYCFFADVNHQAIAKDLDRADYERVARLLAHTGVHRNDYEAYRCWGSVMHPWRTFSGIGVNWALWYAITWGVGGHALATAVFSGAMLWAIGIRTFNYQGHGRGDDRRREGVDFNWRDRSINQLRPGWLGGEWHNNHHLFPNSARAGFLWHQPDTTWWTIQVLRRLGGISSVRDYRSEFLREYYEPWRRTRGRAAASSGKDPDV